MKLFKNKKIKTLLTVVVLVAAALFVYKNYTKTEDQTEQTQQSITATVEKGKIRETISASGQIETANYLAVTTSVNGIVKQVFVNEGDTVTKGQQIMEITLNSEGEENKLQAWSSYLSAKNSLESEQNILLTKESALINAEESFEDEKKNNSYQTHDERTSYRLAENEYNTAKTNYDLQQEKINQAQINLSKAWLTYQAQSSIIVSPGEGVIANIVVVEGMEISNSLSERTSATVASVRKEGTPIATLNISEVDINKISVGQDVELTLTSIKDQVFMGKVVGIDKIGTSSSGVSNYPVIVKFNENVDEVLPNMGLDAEIIIQEKENALYVPSAAVTSVRGNTVLRVKGEERPVQVETGITTTDYTEIVSGVSENTEITMTTLPTSGFTSDSEGFGPSGGMFPGVGGGRR